LIDSNLENVTESVLLHTDRQGADVCYDAAGAQSTFSAGVACLKKGGTLVTLANLDLTFQLDMASLITRELTIRGSCASSGEYTEIIDLLEKGKLRTDYCVSKVLPLSDGGDFIIKLHNKEIKDFNKLILLPQEKEGTF
jgi:threonine dehydrogenase-like Zn-dependent dehydrogenase